MTQAKIEFAVVTMYGNQFLFLAAAERAFVGENFRFVRFAELIDMLTDCHVGRNAAWRWHRFPTQRTRWHLDVLLVGRRAFVLLVAEMARAAKGTAFAINILRAIGEKRMQTASPQQMRSTYCLFWRLIWLLCMLAQIINQSLEKLQ